MRKEWENWEIEYLKNNLNKKTFVEIAEVLNRTRNSVQMKSNKLGLKVEDKYFYDKNYFENINNEEKAYWLGFIAGDGYIIRNERQAELGIELNEIDYDHLKKFNKCLKGNVEVKFRQRKDSRTLNNYKMCLIRFYSWKLVDDLIKLGIIPNKSLVIKFPNISSKFYIPFLRGYFDANGSLCLNKKRESLQCDFCSGSIEMIESIRKILFELEINSYITYEKESKAIRLNIKGLNNSYNFCKLLYENSKIYLDRKYNKFYRLCEENHIVERVK